MMEINGLSGMAVEVTVRGLGLEPSFYAGFFPCPFTTKLLFLKKVVYGS